MASTSLEIFQYIADLDCFVVTEQYRRIADELGLIEWNPVVWIGRLFLMDNDVGEHWFDNWELREQLRPQAEQRGIAYSFSTAYSARLVSESLPARPRNPML